MGRREIAEENVRVIQKSKRSYYITLPIQIVREFKWRDGQKIVVEKKGKELIVKDWEK